MKLTPREPTREMMIAADEQGLPTLIALDVWRAMHDAAPSVPSVEQELLEALALLLLETEDYPEVMPQTLRKARAAIARAKGE